MCGILGVFNNPDHERVAQKGFEEIKTRGQDAQHLLSRKDYTLGHALHAVVGHQPQPLTAQGTLVANCEIYNYKTIDNTADNDAKALLHLLDKTALTHKAVKGTLEKLDGDFAFIYTRNDEVIFARDLVGVKPLWYAHQDGLAIASEKKALLAAGAHDVQELNPRMIGHYCLSTNSLTLWQQPFYHKEKSTKEEQELAQEVKEKLISAINKRLPSKSIKTGVLFSGGVDSTLIAKILSDLGADFTCYTAVVRNPQGAQAHDALAAKAVAERYGLPLTLISVDQDKIPLLAKTVTQEIEEAHAVKVAVGMPFYVCAQAAAQDGCRVLFSGLGAEELFAGYQRHKEASDVNDECLNGLLWMYERDLYRDDVLTMNQGVELRVPYLDKELIRLAMSIPSSMKISKGTGKYILREASLLLGLDREDAYRPKRAAQYGSNFDKELQRVAKKEGRNRAEYLRQFMPGANRKLAVLCSGGKDSWYAAQVMAKQNYELSCLAVMKSMNPDSYMFHTPAIEMVTLQSHASGIPLVEMETQGEKEEELIDLSRLLLKAKEEYHVDGVVVGALYSQYQRERVERVCNELGLKPFSPLWHIRQASEVRELLDNGFSVMITAVAGEGMSRTWVGRMLDKQALKELLELEKKTGFNVGGEGGEYESLVVDCPLFSKKIIVEGETVMENEMTGRLNITKAHMSSK